MAKTATEGLPKAVLERWRAAVALGGVEVTLKTGSLARHEPLLVEGAKGRTLPPVGRSAFSVNRYLRVQFGEREFDILWKDLKVTDEKWSAWRENEKKALDMALDCFVKRADLIEGGRGGFRSLVVTYNNGRPADVWYDKQDARPVIERLRAAGHLKAEEKTHGSRS